MFHQTSFNLEKSLIATKLSKLRGYQRFLKELQATSIEDFISDFKTRGAVERYLQVSIERIVDIGNEIISSLQLQRPERYGDIPYILAEAKIIPKIFAEKIALMIGFRNLLVHDYASINLNLVYEFLQTRPLDFEAFTKYIAR
jgi:uncharacterized protein YutE (UPF0331/DUF86 family)